MAFSMFLRSSACPNRAFAQQIMKFGTQPISRQMPIRPMVLQEAKATPLLNAVRSFRTTSVRLAEKSHDHSKLWVIEKGVSAALIPLIPLALLMPNKLFDVTLAILVTAHSYWGLEAIAVDYVRASIVGPIIPKIAIGFVYLISIATLGGLFYLITHDVGFANAVKQLWAVKSQSQKA